MTQEGAQLSLLPGTKKNKPFDIAGFVRRYAVIIIVAGNFGFTILAPFALMAIKPFYKVSARIKIDPITQVLIGKGEEASILSQYASYARTQSMRLREHSILEEAVRRLTPEQKDAQFFRGLPLELCATMLDKRLYAKPISRSHLMNLALQGRNPEGLAELLNNIMTVYIERMEYEQKAKNSNRLNYLRNEYSELKKRIREKTDILEDIARKSSTSSFAEAFNLYYKKAEKLQQVSVSLYERRIEAENKFNRLLREKEQITAIPMRPQVEEMVANDWGLDSTQSWTYQQMQKMRAQLDGLTQTNDDRQYIEERMKAMGQYEKDMNDDVRKLARVVIYGKRDYELKTRLIRAENEYKALLKAEKTIMTELNKARQEASVNSVRLITGEELQAELRHLRELLFRLETRISELGVQSNAPGRVSITTPALAPKKPAGDNAKKLFMICLVLPFGAVGAVLFMLEFMDRRITSPKNIEQALGHPSTWPVSQAPAGTTFARITLDAPECVASKAIRSLAIRLFRDNQRNRTKVFLFNGIDEKSGTTEILLNTSHNLGRMLPSILIIEANSNAPALRRLLGVEDDYPGIDEIIRGKKTLEQCIYTDFERNVNVLFASREKITSEANLILRMLLEESIQKFDMILIDAMPIMKSDLTEYLATHADVAVLVIQGNRTMYGMVRRVAEFFIRMEIPAIAAVLNWGGPRYVTPLEKFFSRPYLKFIRNRLYGPVPDAKTATEEK